MIGPSGICPHGQYASACLDCRFEAKQRAASAPVQGVAPHTDDPRAVSRVLAAQREFLRRAERAIETGDSSELDARIDRWIKEA